MSFKIQKILIIASAFLFITSLCCPAIEDMDLLDKPEVLPGILVLAWGWFAITFLHPAWLANITWLATFILFFNKRPKSFLVMSIISALLSLDSYLYPSKKFIGFWLWNAAINLPLLVALITIISTRLRKNSNHLN